MGSIGYASGVRRKISCIFKEYEGDYKDLRLRFLRTRSRLLVMKRVQMARMMRPDIHRYKLAVLEIQLEAKFGRKKYVREKLKKLLRSKPEGAPDKPDEKLDRDVAILELMEMVLRETQDKQANLGYIKEIFNRTTDDRLLEYAKTATRLAADRKSGAKTQAHDFVIAVMLLRPKLFANAQKLLFSQMNTAPSRATGFIRLSNVVAEKAFPGLSTAEIVHLVDLYLSACAGEDFCMPTTSDAPDTMREASRFRFASRDMLGVTYEFMVGVARKFGYDAKKTLSSSKKEVKELAKVIPAALSDQTSVRILAYALLQHRLSIPSLSSKQAIVFWQKDFRRGTLYNNGGATEFKDSMFVYARCFENVAEMVGRFVVSSAEFKDAVAIAGGEDVVVMITLSLLYAQRYDQLMQLVKAYSGEQSFAATPCLFMAHIVAQYRTGQLSEATENVLNMLADAVKLGWTSVDVRLARHQMPSDDELKNCPQAMKEELIYLIRREHAAHIATHLLYNLLFSAVRDRADANQIFYAAAILLAQVDFAPTGKALYEALAEGEMKEVVRNFHFEALMKHTVCGYMIKDYSRLIDLRGDAFLVTEAQKEKQEMTSSKSDKKHSLHLKLLEHFVQRKKPLFESLNDFFQSYIDDIIRITVVVDDPMT